MSQGVSLDFDHPASLSLQSHLCPGWGLCPTLASLTSSHFYNSRSWYDTVHTKAELLLYQVFYIDPLSLEVSTSLFR